METLLQGLSQVFIYIDDILITGKTEEEHLKNLTETLERLEKAGVRLKEEKCAFLLPTVEYLGHVLSADDHLSIKEKCTGDPGSSHSKRYHTIKIIFSDGNLLH